MLRQYILIHIAGVLMLLGFVAIGNCEETKAADAVGRTLQQFLSGPVQVQVRNEVTGEIGRFETQWTPTPSKTPPTRHPLDKPGILVEERCSATERGMSW
jgi:hypothetical protein